jgi:hypothetical protein
MLSFNLATVRMAPTNGKTHGIFDSCTRCSLEDFRESTLQQGRFM